MFSDMGVNMEDLKKKAGDMPPQQEMPNQPFKQNNFFEEEGKKEAPKKKEEKICYRDLGN